MKSNTPFKPLEGVILKSPTLQSGRVTKKQKKPPNFSDATSLVTFVIGPSGDQKNFIVHKEVACYHSKVFDAAFNSDFVEGQTQTYHIDDTSERAFRLLVQWMYFQKLELFQLNSDNLSNDVTEEAEDPEANRKSGPDEDRGLVELWVLADKLHMTRLQNLVLENIESIYKKTDLITFETFDYVYDNTLAESQLRKYFVELCAVELTEYTYREFETHFHREMLIDILEYHTRAREGGGEESDDERDVSNFFVAVEED